MGRTWDPTQLVITFGGYHLTGYADGTFCNVERNEDMWSLQMGTDGTGTRSKSSNRSGRVTVTLMQSSPSNDVLSDFALADEATNGAALPLMVKDINGTSLYSAEKAWLVKTAPAEHGREATGREWVFETDELLVHVGSND